MTVSIRARHILAGIIFSMSACSPASGPAPSMVSASSAPTTATSAIQTALITTLETATDFPLAAHPVLMQITQDHTAQLAKNPENTDFQVQQAHTYIPVAPDALSLLLQQKQLFSSDNIVTVSLSDGDPEQLKARFKSELSKVLGTMPFSHYGLSVFKQGPSWFMSCVLVTQVVQFDTPPAMHYDAPLQLLFKGSIEMNAFANPRVLMTSPDGKVHEVQERVVGKQFNTTLPLNQKGLYSIEVEVEGPFGGQPACNFIVAVGVPFPEVSPVNTRPEPLGDLARAQQTLLQLINQDRVSLGFAPLQLHEGLNRVSQAHSQDMVDQQFVGHNSPTLGTPQQQAFAFQLSDNVAQNVAVNTHLDQAHAKLMSSPGHRETLLSPHYTHVGFGVVQAEDGQLYITQNFTEQKLKLSPLPTQVARGDTFEIVGEAVESGVVGVFVNKVQKSVTPVEAGKSFRIPLQLTDTGSQRLLIGFSAEAQATQLKVYNLWDIDVN